MPALPYRLLPILVTLVAMIHIALCFAGTVRVRTQNSDTLFFESSLLNAQQVTGVHLHLSPGHGAVFGKFYTSLLTWMAHRNKPESVEAHS